MADRIEPIPDNMTIREASEFWDTHSVADYPTQVVEIEYSPGERVTLVAVASDLLTKVEEKARERGISVETLVNLWIQEKVM
ncbi:MAG: BrnA antitoxin family protein [Chloroflexi bacterium]|nr:BrnA antitoxin family protein [Chloroflexota bacterium]MCI0726011.1 BrnA antitoxin family protein [Chloroflexota bacterium]